MDNNYFGRTLRRTFDISGIDISEAGVKRLSDSTEFCYACYPIIEVLKVLKGSEIVIRRHHSPWQIHFVNIILTQRTSLLIRQ